MLCEEIDAEDVPADISEGVGPGEMVSTQVTVSQLKVLIGVPLVTMITLSSFHVQSAGEVGTSNTMALEATTLGQFMTSMYK